MYIYNIALKKYNYFLQILLYNINIYFKLDFIIFLLFLLFIK